MTAFKGGGSVLWSVALGTDYAAIRPIWPLETKTRGHVAFGFGQVRRSFQFVAGARDVVILARQAIRERREEFPSEFELIDDMVQVEDGVAFRACRELLRSEAVMAGGSSGAAYWGIREVAASVKPGTRIVTVFPDSGTRYLKTLYNDDWMKKHGFLQ